MSLDMRLLFSFISIDPNFTSVLLCGDQLCQLIGLVKQLFPLDVILCLKRLLLDLKRVCLAFNLSQLLLLLFILALVGLEELITFVESFLDFFVLLLEVL